MVIVFDFDGVLDNYKLQLFAKKAIAENNKVWICTKRKEGEHNKDLKRVIDFIMLPESMVVYTNGKRKADIIMALNADLFIDNETKEFDYINNYSNTIALPFL